MSIGLKKRERNIGMLECASDWAFNVAVAIKAIKIGLKTTSAPLRMQFKPLSGLRLAAEPEVGKWPRQLKLVA